MKIKVNQYIIGLIAAATLGSCAIPKNAKQQPLATMPTQYGNDSLQLDSNTMAHIKYQAFFNDQHLLNLIDTVLAHNFDYKIAQEKINIAAAYLSASRGAMLPSLSADVLASGTKYGKYTIDGVGNFDTNLSPNIDPAQRINTKFSPNYWLGLNTNWEIDLWGKLRALKDADKARFVASVEGVNLLKSALITQTAVLYYDLVTLNKEITILKENLQLQEKAYEVVKIQKQAGRATELAVQQFKAQLANTRALLVEDQQRIMATENQLLALTGKFNGKIAHSNTLSINGLNLLVKHGQPQQLLAFRPDIRLQTQALAAAKLDTKAARAAFFPTLSVSAFAGYNAFNNSFWLKPASFVYQLLGNATAPIFQKNQIKANFKIANAEQEIAFNTYQNTVVNAYHEVRTLLSYIDKNEEILQYKKEEAQALDQSVEVANYLYATAYASYLEIIAAQKNKIEAELSRLATERNQIQAHIQLYKALGGAW